MSDLVSEEAWDRAWIEVASVRDASPRRPDDADTGDVVTAALSAAAPLILAAEPLAADAEANPHGGYYDGMSEAAGIVRDRASVLRGEGDPTDG